MEWRFWRRRDPTSRIGASVEAKPPSAISARPLFVLGVPRSGTTLVAKVLNAHPNVLITNETRPLTFFKHALDVIPTGDKGGLHCAREHGAEFAAALKASGKDTIERAYAAIADVQGKRELCYWGDKNPHASDSLELLEGWFPDAKLVVVRRDLRDTVCSILELWCRMGIVSVSDSDDPGCWSVTDEKLQTCCNSVRSAVRAEEAYVARKPKSASFRLEYERLLEDPEGVLGRLCVEFLGLADPTPMIQHIAKNKATDVHGFLQGKVDFADRSVGRWRRDLSPDQRELVTSAFREDGMV